MVDHPYLSNTTSTISSNPLPSTEKRSNTKNQDYWDTVRKDILSILELEARFKETEDKLTDDLEILLDSVKNLKKSWKKLQEMRRKTDVKDEDKIKECHEMNERIQEQIKGTRDRLKETDKEMEVFRDTVMKVVERYKIMEENALGKRKR